MVSHSIHSVVFHDITHQKPVYKRNKVKALSYGVFYLAYRRFCFIFSTGGVGVVYFFPAGGGVVVGFLLLPRSSRSPLHVIAPVN
jgi:hypothetical protein